VQRRRCATCGEEKSTNGFYIDNRTGSASGKNCRVCRCAAARKRYAEDPDGRQKRNEQNRRSYAKNPTRGREYTRRYRLKMSQADRDRYLRCQRNQHLKRKYGLTLERQVAIFARQDNSCAICLSTEPGTKHGWSVDHDHADNQIRGILCQKCNSMLGYARDSGEILARAIDYLGAAGAGK